jgi:hypothetical protein
MAETPTLYKTDTTDFVVAYPGQFANYCKECEEYGIPNTSIRIMAKEYDYITIKLYRLNGAIVNLGEILRKKNITIRNSPRKCSIFTQNLFIFAIGCPNLERIHVNPANSVRCVQVMANMGDAGMTLPNEAIISTK